jgi:hypothetical protein
MTILCTLAQGNPRPRNSPRNEVQLGRSGAVSCRCPIKSTGGLFVTNPLVSESLLQLPLLAPDEEVDERQVKRGDREGGWRSEQQTGAEEEEEK